MALKSLYRDGGIVCHGQDCDKLADYSSMSHTQVNGFISNPRRSLRLKEIAAIYKEESAIPVVLSSKHQQETGTDACLSSPNLAKAEMSLYDSSQGSPKQKSNVDVIESDDESNTSITLMDLVTRCKIKKRKTFEVKVQTNVDIQEHNTVPVMSNEDDIELEKTISCFKVKKTKSSPTSEKSNKHTKPTIHSSMAEKKTVLTFPLASVASESRQDEETPMETIPDELSVNSKSSPRHKKEIVDGNIKEFVEQNPHSVGSPTAFVIKKEVNEACFDESDDENSMMNSATVFVKKCDFDNEYLSEVLDKASEKKDLDQPDNVVSNMMDPFLRDIIKQCKHDFSSSPAPRLENFQIPSHDAINVKSEHLIVGSTKCEGTTPNAGLLLTFEHHRNLPTEVSHNEDQQMQFKELMLSEKRRDVGLITAESSTEFIVSDCEKLACFSENDSWLDENRKNSFSDMPFNQRIISMVPEFKSSYSFDNFAEPIDCSVVSLSSENNSNFIDGLKNDSIDRNNWLSAIHRHKSLNIGSDRKRSMGSENCAELVSQPLSTCSFSQMDQSIPSNDTLTLVGTPCLITEAEYPYENPIFDDIKQASHYDGDSLGAQTTADYLLDADELAQKDKLLPSPQMQTLNRCSKGKPCCAKVSDLTDAVRPSGEIVCLCPVSQQHEIEASTQDQVKDGLSKSATGMDTTADFPCNSSFEFSTQNCVEKQINMQTTEIQTADMKFGGNLCMEAGHSPKKLLSNRKEISPKSQEKLLWALNNGGLDDVVKLSSCMKMLCFDKTVSKKPLSSVLDNGETFLEIEQMIKKPQTMNQSLPVVTKGILKSPDTICCNPCCVKNSSIHAQIHDAILFSQRQMQDTENIATKLLKELNSLKSIVEETIFSEGLTSPSKLNVDEIRLATKHASKLEVTTKKWLAMMAKDCTRFCKIMRSAENKSTSPTNDIHKGRKKITFADEAGGSLCQFKTYEQQPADFISPKSLI